TFLGAVIDVLGLATTGRVVANPRRTSWQAGAPGPLVRRASRPNGSRVGSLPAHGGPGPRACFGPFVPHRYPCRDGLMPPAAAPALREARSVWRRRLVRFMAPAC